MPPQRAFDFDRLIETVDHHKGSVGCVASFRPWRNTVTRCGTSASAPLRRSPTTGIVDCCPRAASGQATAPPSSVMNSRRPHSITSSARASSVGGTSRPSALAVLRLMTNSNLVGCCTGRSPGLAPLKILST